jgi:hypothetical protein
MIVLFLLFDTIPAPLPGQEIYWIAGLLATGIGVLFWQLKEAGAREVAAVRESLVRCQSREDKLIEADAVKTTAVRDLTVQSTRAADLTAQVLQGSGALREGIDRNSKQIDECVSTANKALETMGQSIQGNTLELRNLASQLGDLKRTASSTRRQSQ